MWNLFYVILQVEFSMHDQFSDSVQTVCQGRDRSPREHLLDFCCKLSTNATSFFWKAKPILYEDIRYNQPISDSWFLSALNKLVSIVSSFQLKCDDIYGFRESNFKSENVGLRSDKFYLESVWTLGMKFEHLYWSCACEKPYSWCTYQWTVLPDKTNELVFSRLKTSEVFLY